MSDTTHTSKWRWLTGDTLIEDHGKRNVVLTISSDRRTGSVYLSTRGDDGILVPLLPDHPIARLIAAAPGLLRIAEEYVKHGPDCCCENNTCFWCQASSVLYDASGGRLGHNTTAAAAETKAST